MANIERMPLMEPEPPKEDGEEAGYQLIPQTEEEKRREYYKDVKRYWDKLNEAADDDNVNRVQYLLKYRDTFKHEKLPDEANLFYWLSRRAEAKNIELLFKLDEEGFIVPK